MSLVGIASATDPTIIGRQLARALGAIVCRCIHPKRAVYPCEGCAKMGRTQASRLGRLLFMYVQGVPYGECQPTESEYMRVGRLLEQVERLAAGQQPVTSDD